MTPVKINRDEVKSLKTEGLLSYTAARMVNMTGNPHFTTPLPTVLAMKLLSQNFRDADALSRQIRSVLNTQARTVSYDALIAGHMSWIDYIEETPGLTREQILTTGYTPYAVRTIATVPSPGVKPTYSTTVNTGEIFLKTATYKQGSHKIFYNWKVSEDQGATWQNLITTGNASRRKVSGLELNKEYWFRIAYATVAGEGEASDHVVVLLTQDSKHSLKARSKADKNEPNDAA